MSDPSVMRDAIKALRAESGHSHAAESTRQRIVGTVTRRKRQRRQVIASLAFVLLGLPLGGTAYAAFFGTPVFVQRWMELLTPVEHVVATHPLSTSGEGKWGAVEVEVPTATSPVATTVAAPGHVAMPIASSPGVIPPVIAPNVVDAVTPNAPVVAHASVTSDPQTRSPLATRGEGKVTPRRIHRGEETRASQALSTPTVPIADRSDALYARAHELHFVTRDPAAALVAWDAYLTQATTTSLRLEAEYNRALCLVRLRRNTEAIDALTRFANGQHGNYRKREATALVEALQR